ncbi:MAG: 16S/23S rRNA (cytidine-2'-O)-methyltransferase, partial [Acidimicrobiia bacterium]|nr:16S/23S rRNA (cytidine-2'-O)-methyltransferase [Acidimicrobiia bacterium]
KVFDRTNIRNVGPDELGATFDLIVADLSFISLCTVAPALAALAEDGADLVLLVKPQFEVGRGDVGKGGIVRDSEARAGAVRSVIECLGRAGIGTQAVCASPVPGAKGNREFFVWCVRSAPTRDVEIPE